MALTGNSDETNGYNSVIKNGTLTNANLVKSVIPPIGVIMAWHKTFANTPALPDGWVECDGSVLSDGDSPYDSQTIPDLNGQNNFLRGNSTSGDVDDGGSETHTHSHDAGAVIQNGNDQGATHTTANHLPPYMNIVWIMRVK